MVLAADRPTAIGGRRVGMVLLLERVHLGLECLHGGCQLGDERREIDEIDGVEDGGVVGGGASEEVAWWGWLEVEEDLLEADTRLSRAPASRVAGPRLQSS